MDKVIKSIKMRTTASSASGFFESGKIYFVPGEISQTMAKTFIDGKYAVGLPLAKRSKRETPREALSR